MSGITASQLQLFKTSIPAMRKAAGWTLEEFGDRLGITKQAVSLLEHDPEKMPSKTLYIAARYVMKDELQAQPENKALASIYKLAFADTGELEAADVEKITQALALTTGGLASGLAFAAIVGGLALILGSVWDALGLDL